MNIGKPVDLDLECIQIKPEPLYTYVGYDDEGYLWKVISYMIINENLLSTMGK